MILPLRLDRRVRSHELTPRGVRRLYRAAREGRAGVGPELTILSLVTEVEALDPELAEAVVRLFDRALVRARFPPGDAVPAIAIRVDEEIFDVEPQRRLAVRVLDTGPIADPFDIRPFLIPDRDEVVVRREPPAGPWNGVSLLRFPANSR